VEIIYFARTEPIDVPLNLETGLAP
jgi:hypothetical protein